MTKTIKQRLGNLEAARGELPVMVFEQTWDDENLFYLASKSGHIMAKRNEIDTKDLMTRTEAEAMAGNNNTALFIVYVKDWRGYGEG